MKHAILCVDDEFLILESLKIELENSFHGRFLIETAGSGEDALELIEELNKENVEIILILSDWLMPGLKGDDFLIRVHQRYPHIKAIMITGQADDQSIENAKNNAHLYSVIRKPWDASELTSEIEKCIQDPSN